MSRTNKIVAVVTLALAAFVAVGGAAAQAAPPTSAEAYGVKWR